MCFAALNMLVLKVFSSLKLYTGCKTLTITSNNGLSLVGNEIRFRVWGMTSNVKCFIHYIIKQFMYYSFGEIRVI